jgi:YidC/Oxa1 family membrane protein insertase
MNDNTNFILAIALSIGILIGWHYLYEKPKQVAEHARVEAQEILAKAPEAEKQYATPRKHDEVLSEAPRLAFGNEKIKGSINLKGGRVDDLTLTRYRQTIDPNSPNIVLLSPAGSAEPYAPFYAEFGWLSNDADVKVPGANTVWSGSGNLAPGSDVTLRWDNGAGLTFERVISLDKDYLFKVTDSVKNASGKDVTLYPFGLVSRHGTPHTLGFATLHEGPLGVFNDTLHEKNYKQMREKPIDTTESADGGWVGITDVYWLAGIIADPKDKITGRFIYQMAGPQERFQTDIQKAPVVVKSGESAASNFHLFAGAKEVAVLDNYKDKLPAPMLDRAIDFGWFYFIAKPFFHAIDFIGGYVGNYGLAIIIFTILLRGLFFPMSEASYRNMEAMKALKPQMDKLKERYGSDPAKLNTEVTALYKKEKLNPLAGCLPVLIQIPVFFALYKVLLIAIEMRHAPFYWWIKDLSAPDPSNLFTLFGLVPWSAHVFGFPLQMGALPLLMGITMFIQQKLSPPPSTDKTTQQIFTWMPVIFTFLLVNMSAGLVLYWIFSNILAIAQQTLIKHRATKKA